ncbi:MAG: GNAT family N-acetyltransferase [Burkholderiaceae bacterium]
MNYRMQLLAGFAEVDPKAWDALVAASPRPTPFMQHAFLQIAEQTESACPETGWTARPLLLFSEDDELVAAAALYAKAHSYGEYVFDWAWARAYEQAGLRYFPKWLVASPFSPVPGSRLLGANEQARHALAVALGQLTKESGLSSCHILFAHESDQEALESTGWLIRKGVQFHWFNKNYIDFEAFLSQLSQPKRKKVRAERRKVTEAGLRCRVVTGKEISPELLAFFYRCYSNTYYEHGNPPYFSENFFAGLLDAMPENLVLSLAEDAKGSLIASALLMKHWDDMAQETVLYGRYWGSTQYVPCLHFELAYYTPIEWAIAQGIARFEGGAQGEHKMARGFEPVPMGSAHWISEPRFRDAVTHFLEREGEGMSSYFNELEERTAFKSQEKAP